MARIIRGSLVLGLLLVVTACRFSAARQEAFFRFAVSSILKAAATADGPESVQAADPALVARATNAPLVSSGAVAATWPAPLAPAAADAPMISAAAPRTEIKCVSLRVNTIRISPSALRPSVEVSEPLFRPEAVSLERQLLLANLRIVRSEIRRLAYEAKSARCSEARARAEETLRELRAAHVIPPVDDGRSCFADPDAALSLPAFTESSLRQTIGG